ncbi:carbon storage regulator CsrA [Bacillus spongiae]|uniref:Translational regulator CsrA n=1 Tax=Bacillus spongiae TaxID=2683610 RepID=A0ABU8HE14_9BACI
MLILNRKPGEAIQIGENIELVVVSLAGEQVKLGINAPRHIDIHRKEIYLSIQEENNAATKHVEDLSKLLPTNVKK